MPIEDAVKWADIVQILIPDEIQAEVYENQIKPNMKPGQYLMFSHGFNITIKNYCTSGYKRYYGCSKRSRTYSKKPIY